MICICVVALFRKYDRGREASGGGAVLLCVWLVAAAVWGRPFFELTVPGLFDVTVDRVLLAGMLVMLLVGMGSGRVSFARCPGLELALLVLILCCLFSMALHGFLPALPSLPSPWNTFINGYLFPVIAFVYARCFIRNPQEIRLVFSVIFWLGAYLSVTAFFEFFGIRSLVFPRYISSPEILIHLDRARGPFLNAAFNGAGIIFGFICGLHLLAGKRGLSRVFYVALLALAPIAVFFTQTRSAYLTFAIVLVLFLGFYRMRIPKWKAFALPIALLIAFIVLNLPRMASEDRRTGGVVQTNELEIRLGLAQRSLSIAAMAPFLGVGMGQFLPVSKANFPGEVSASAFHEEIQHFHVLGLLAELGITGAVLYLIVIVFVFRRLYALSSALPARGFANGNMIVAMTAVWIVYLSTNLFLEPSYCLFFNAVPFVFAGVADGMYTRLPE